MDDLPRTCVFSNHRSEEALVNCSYREVCEAAARAGGEVLRGWLGRIRAREKGRNDLVTEADVESQQVIQQLVLTRFPEHLFLGEESTDEGRPDLRQAFESDTPVWIVDPLDGTTNFVHGLPAFSVSVAVSQRGRTVAGVVYDPIADECFSATAGGGAFLNGEAIRVSDCRSLDQALVAASFSAHVERDSPEIRRFVEVMMRCQAIRRFGSAALNLCYVAAGRLDGYWATSVKAWDVAAGCLILAEAGGQVTHIDGRPFSLLDPRFASSATESLHGELVEVLKAAG